MLIRYCTRRRAIDVFPQISQKAQIFNTIFCENQGNLREILICGTIAHIQIIDFEIHDVPRELVLVEAHRHVSLIYRIITEIENNDFAKNLEEGTKNRKELNDYLQNQHWRAASYRGCETYNLCYWC